MIDEKNRLVTILGPTACGKTALAVHLAQRLNGEIISGDSRQVYKQMDLGSGKDLSEYTIDGKDVPYHLIDIVDPGYRYNVFEYQQDFVDAYQLVQSKGRLPILCGGSGMYIESVLRDYQLVSIPPHEDFRLEYEAKELDELNEIARQWGLESNISDKFNKKRIIRVLERHQFRMEDVGGKDKSLKINPLIVGLNLEVELRRKRIAERLHERLNAGLVDEVKSLLENGVDDEALFFYGLEYRFVSFYLQGVIDYSQMVDQLNIAIRQFAKRQMTWFRRMEKNGFTIHWLDGTLSMEEKISKSLDLFYK